MLALSADLAQSLSPHISQQRIYMYPFLNCLFFLESFVLRGRLNGYTRVINQQFHPVSPVMWSALPSLFVLNISTENTFNIYIFSCDKFSFCMHALLCIVAANVFSVDGINYFHCGRSIDFIYTTKSLNSCGILKGHKTFNDYYFGKYSLIFNAVIKFLIKRCRNLFWKYM